MSPAITALRPVLPARPVTVSLLSCLLALLLLGVGLLVPTVSG